MFRTLSDDEMYRDLANRIAVASYVQNFYTDVLVSPDTGCVDFRDSRKCLPNMRKETFEFLDASKLLVLERPYGGNVLGCATVPDYFNPKTVVELLRNPEITLLFDRTILHPDNTISVDKYQLTVTTEHLNVYLAPLSDFVLEHNYAIGLT